MDGRMYLVAQAQCQGSGISDKGVCPCPWSTMPLPGGTPPAERHETVLDDIALCLGEGAATGQAVHGVQHGVHHDGSVLGAREEGRALGDEWQHGQTQVAV